MSEDIDKPYVLRVAELIYSKITDIKKENPEMSNIQAFEVFMTTNDYDLISSGEFHDKWFLELKNSNFIDKISGKKINDETMRLLEMQKDSMVKFLIKIPKLYYTKSHFPLEISQRAFDHLWRVCESYEMWCNETKQKKLIVLFRYTTFHNFHKLSINDQMPFEIFLSCLLYTSDAADE